MPKKPSVRRKLNRREQRDLDIEISFLEGLVRRDGDYLEALQILGDDYTKRGRFDDGLKIDQRLSCLRPQDPLVHYNLACSFALTDQLDASIQALDHAIRLGYSDFNWLARDPDLKKLRRHPSFRQLRSKIKELRTGQKSSPQP